jgi:hypothetical protein
MAENGPSWLQKKTYSISSFLMTLGAFGFLLSSFLYYGFLEVDVVMPVSHTIGFIGSTAMMAVSISISFWTADTKTVTFFGLTEWAATIVFLVALFAPLAFSDLWAAYKPLSASLGVLAGMVFWTLGVRDKQ